MFHFIFRIIFFLAAIYLTIFFHRHITNKPLELKKRLSFNTSEQHDKFKKPSSTQLNSSSNQKQNSSHTKNEKNAWTQEDKTLRTQLAQKFSLPKKFVSYHDVLFYKEFPSFAFVKNSTYSIMTEKKSMPFKNAYTALNVFSKHFMQRFRPLIAKHTKKNLEVVFFDKKDTFEQFKAKIQAPKWAEGFYHFNHKRLYIYNSLDINKTSSVLPYVRVPFKYKEILVPTLSGQMDQVLTIMRHEGAHQLFDHFHILHPKFHSWLHEGFACYSEKPQIGMAHRQYQLLLGLLSPLSVKQLTSLQHFGQLNQMQALQCYASSWCLVYYLMQPSRKNLFFNYLVHLRKKSSQSNQFSGGNIGELSKFLKTTPDKLEQDFKNFASQMAIK